MVSRPANGFSKNYVKIGISSDVEYRNLIKNIKKSNNILVEKEIDYRIMSVFYNQHFDINMLWGQIFDENQFKSNSMVAIIDKSIKKSCIKKGGTLYYKYHNDYLKVVGIFEKRNNTVNEDSLVYIPLTTAINNNYVLKNGTYYVEDFDLNKKNFGNILYENRKQNIVDLLQKTIQEQLASVLSLLLIMFMMLINLFGIINYWIIGRKKVIRAMNIVGATKKNINRFLIVQYYTNIFFSFILALPVSCLMTLLPWKEYDSFKISLQSIFFSLAVVLAFSLPGVIFMLIYKKTNNV